MSSVHDSIDSNKVTHGIGNKGSVPNEVTVDYLIWSHFGQVLSPPPSPNTVCVCACKIIGNPIVVAATPTA